MRIGGILNWFLIAIAVMFGVAVGRRLTGTIGLA